MTIHGPESVVTTSEVQENQKLPPAARHELNPDDQLVAALGAEFAPCLEQITPRGYEVAARGLPRQEGQPMSEHARAAVNRPNQLEREGAQLSSEARGYLAMRNARLGGEGVEVIRTGAADGFAESEAIKVLQ